MVIYASSKTKTETDKIFTNGSNSLLLQSNGDRYLPHIHHGLFHDSNQVLLRNHDKHTDGFGLGWFDESGKRQRKRSKESILKYVNPKQSFDFQNATLDSNDVYSNEMSNIVFAHIRAATEGTAKEENSHPFMFDRDILWMHNGGISETQELRKRIEEIGLCSHIKGETDSELAGALFAHKLGQIQEEKTIETFVSVLKDTIHDIQSSQESQPSSLNFAVTDGRHVLVTRYRTSSKEDPPSLYYKLSSESPTCQLQTIETCINNDEYQAIETFTDTLVVASEPLDKDSKAWRLLAKDQMLAYDTKSGKLDTYCLSQSCLADHQHKYEKGLLSRTFPIELLPLRALNK